MKSFLTLIPIFSLLSTTTLAQSPHATLSATACPGVTADAPGARNFTIEVNTLKPVSIDLPQICTLTLLNSTPSTLLSALSCTAYSDAAGQQIASAPFTAKKPGSLSTTPVGVGSVWCRDVRLPAVSSGSGLASGSGAVASSTGEVESTRRAGITMGLPIGVSQTQTARLAVPTGNSTRGGNGTTGYGGGYTNAGVMVGKMGGIGAVMAVLVGTGLAALVL